MGWGKILGLAAIGVGAVAAAPFTGGGSIFAASGAVASLAGAGTIAAATGAAAVGAVAGTVMSRQEEEEEERKQRQIVKANEQAKRATKIVAEHEEHNRLIIALTALGVSMANVDGNISDEERLELDEFVGGLSSSAYPENVRNQIQQIIESPPTFNEAMVHLQEIPEVEYPEIRNLLVTVMESDGIIHEREKAFLTAYDSQIAIMG